MPTIELLKVGNYSTSGSSGVVTIRTVTTGPASGMGRFLDVAFPTNSGAQGATGPTGATGATGSQGIQGNTGSTGATGSQGTQGVKGDTGTAGTNGTNGNTGAQGSSGVVSVNSPLSNSGTSTTANLSITAASGSSAGSMSASDKTKLDAFPAYASRSFATPTFSAVTTGTQLSSSRDALVNYEFDASIAITVLGTQTVNAVLSYADNSGMSTNPVVLDSQTLTGGGIVGLNLSTTLNLKGMVPAGKYRKVTFTVSATGIGLGNPAAPAALKSGQEVLE